ncbi:MAG TPA: hypothetical protein DCP63_03700 [Bacteroidetes bacterium]|nr:hypothetical protein [Bacteroidota bacterium]
MFLNLAAFFLGIAEGVLARSAALDLDEIGRRKNRAKQNDVQEVFAVVTGRHHADRTADTRL